MKDEVGAEWSAGVRLPSGGWSPLRRQERTTLGVIYLDLVGFKAILRSADRSLYEAKEGGVGSRVAGS